MAQVQHLWCDGILSNIFKTESQVIVKGYFVQGRNTQPMLVNLYLPRELHVSHLRRHCCSSFVQFPPTWIAVTTAFPQHVVRIPFSALSENSTGSAFHAAFLNATNSVLVAAMRWAFSSR